MIKTLIEQNKALLLFLVKFGGLLLIWQICYSFLLKDGWIDIYITKFVAEISKILLSFIGEQIKVYEGEFGSQTLYYNNKPLLKIAHNCNGLILYVLFIVFLISINIGKIKEKFYAILIGVSSLFFINCLRVIALILTEIYAPEYTDFSHKYLYTIVVYSFELWFWMFLINRWTKKHD